MVRTRATTAPTLAPARQEASEPATETVARRGTVAGSGASCLVGVDVGAIVDLVLTICEIE